MMPPFASFGGHDQRSRNVGAHPMYSGDSPSAFDSNQAHRVALRFKDNDAKSSWTTSCQSTIKSGAIVSCDTSRSFGTSTIFCVTRQSASTSHCSSLLYRRMLGLLRGYGLSITRKCNKY